MLSYAHIDETPNCHLLRVFLDGKEISTKAIFMADVEKGIIGRFVFDSDGSAQINSDGTGLIRERIKGDISILEPGEEYDGG